MTRVVISQPMFFPWVGMFEQLRLADIYIHYDDVQFSKGSFTNRVQIKTAQGIKWLTLPVAVHLGDTIRDVRLADGQPWSDAHLSLLAQAFRGAPFATEALDLVGDLYRRTSHHSLAELVMASMHAVLSYFELTPATRFFRSSALGIGGSGSARVLDIVRAVGGDVYVTGHGARNYLQHEAFEAAGVAVEYLDYRKQEYQQLHGAFTPYVSILDLVANRGRAGRDVIISGTKPWREFLHGG